MNAAFDRFDTADVRDLIAEYPLAWLVAEGTPRQSLLPLLGEYDDVGTLTHLLGHMGRSNPLYAYLLAAPSARILFTGPQGYVSPSHAERRDWAPTWNYVQLAITADITFLPYESHAALDTLTVAMEGDRWSARELGARYDGMAAAIIAFRAQIVSLSGRFKLGQDESDATLGAILRNHPDVALTKWMRRFARDR